MTRPPLRWSVAGALALGILVYLLVPRLVDDAWTRIRPVPGGGLLLVAAVALQLCALWIFAALFANGVRQTGRELSTRDALRAALVGAAIIRLVPGGGAVAPAGMAWAVRKRQPGTSGEAVRAAVLSFGTLLVVSGAALLWLRVRDLQGLLGGAATVLGMAGLVVGTAILVVGAVHLQTIFDRLPRGIGKRLSVQLVARGIGRSEAALLGGRWVAEAAALGVALAAFGVELSPAQVLAGFGVVQVIGGIPLSPGGLGLTEAGLVGTLAAFGYHAADVLGAVLVYRAIAYWLPALLGLAAGGWTWGRTQAPAGS